ncbi:MAG: MFS transporter [Gammaproteobacteria bacterium]|nr:MFS transporter [Gammaproteobacteria bacterium]
MNEPQLAGAAPSPWQPLRIRTFRFLWLATLVSNIGSWMHDIGAGWLMASLTESPARVALVQSAMSFPVFLLAMPAGALADILDRRRYLIGVVSWMATVTLLLAVLTITGVTNEWTLLALTFGLGIGTSMMMPAWAAVTPEVVPREQLHLAIALNTMGMNIARAIGPALAGIIVASAGSGAVFVLNGLSFLAVIGALLCWRREPRASRLPAEGFLAALRTGARFVRHASALHAALVRGISFFLFASAMWALLPVIARDLLHGGPRLYGLLLATVGGGAVIGAFVLPRLRASHTNDWLVTRAALLYAVGLFVIGYVRQLVPALLSFACCGMAWITIVSSIQTAAQLALPDWVRSRGIAMLVMSLMGSLAIGSVLWGHVAEWFDIPMALLSAAACIVLAQLLTRRYRLSHGDKSDLTPSRHWRLPEVRPEVTHERGPVMILIHYRVAPGREAEFAGAVRELGVSRRRDGAFAWDLMESAVEPNYFIEYYQVVSWLEHLRQHERVTESDRALQQRIKSDLAPDTLPLVTHFVRCPESS